MVKKAVKGGVAPGFLFYTFKKIQTFPYESK